MAHLNGKANSTLRRLTALLVGVLVIGVLVFWVRTPGVIDGDSYGPYYEGSAFLKAEAPTPPVIYGPHDFSFEEGETGHFVNWTATDADPSSYNVTLDDELIISGSWNSSGEEVIVSCDGLELGNHVYNATFTDTKGNSASDSVRVWVVPTRAAPALEVYIIIRAVVVVISLVAVCYLINAKL